MNSEESAKVIALLEEIRACQTQQLAHQREVLDLQRKLLAIARN